MKIRTAVSAFAISVLVSALGVLPSRAEAQVDPTLPNLVPMFPIAPQQPNWVVTNRLGVPTLEFEILTANIGGQDWLRPPYERGVEDTCTGRGVGYFRMPQTHQYTMYWWDPDLGDWVLLDQRRKTTICIVDDGINGNDPQISCIQELGINFVCGCSSTRYGRGNGQGVTKGWADSYFRGLTGQWSPIGTRTGDFLLTTELDPDQELQAD